MTLTERDRELLHWLRGWVWNVRGNARRENAPTTADIADHLGRSHAAVRKLMTRLERDEFVFHFTVQVEGQKKAKLYKWLPAGRKK